ncbi:ATP-binding cassette domain-containing protein [Cellulomonas sp. ICMP 17802]|uniref:ATP-binding cassette domain-containing protein n=1 Tax=Cellulomonas sp. ICMP 17802 TaxID=3239199 RepID=UPI00351B43B6
MTAAPEIVAPEADAPQADAPQADAPPPAVRARALQLHADRGAVYGPVDLDLAAGALTLIQGPQGAGRTSLLLTLAGRMVPDASCDLVVLGHRLPRHRGQVQREAAVAGFAGVDELDDSVTVGDHVRERLAWLAPWYRRAARADQRRVDAVLAPVFGDRPVPDAGTVVWHLDEVDALLLRIALAMAQRPGLLVVDDVDQVHDRARRRIVWDRLEAIAATGVTVVASCAAADEAAGTAWTVVPVSAPTDLTDLTDLTD